MVSLAAAGRGSDFVNQLDQPWDVGGELGFLGSRGSHDDDAVVGAEAGADEMFRGFLDGVREGRGRGAVDRQRARKRGRGGT